MDKASINMDKTIIRDSQEAGKKFDAIVQRHCNDLLNYTGTAKDWEVDKKELHDILQSYSSKDFYTISAVFAVLCNVLIKNDVYRQVNAFSMDCFMDIAIGEKQMQILEAICDMIFDLVENDDYGLSPKGKTILSHAMELDKNNPVMLIYSFANALIEFKYAPKFNPMVSIFRGFNNTILKGIELWSKKMEQLAIFFRLPFEWKYFLSAEADTFDPPDDPTQFRIPLLYLPYVRMIDDEFIGGPNRKALDSIMKAGVYSSKYRCYAHKMECADHIFQSYGSCRDWKESDLDAIHQISMDSAINRVRQLMLPIYCEDFCDLMTTSLLLSELKHKMEDKQSMIRKFAHEFDNKKADDLLFIAEKLLVSKDEEMVSYGRCLIGEYSNKQDTIRSVYLMRLEFLDETKKLTNLVMQGVRSCPLGNLRELINLVWKRCFLRVLYTVTPIGGTPWGKRLDSYRDEFESQVFRGNTGMIAWMEQRFPLRLSVSSEWERLYFVADDKNVNTADIEKILGRKPKTDDCYGFVFFGNLFAELFYNLLKYADWNQDVLLQFGYDAVEDIFSVHIRNAKAHGIEGERKTGIAVFDRTLTKLNAEAGRDWESSVEIKDGNEIYEITVHLAGELMKGAR